MANNLQKAMDYLTANNRENLNRFKEGMLDVPHITQKTGVSNRTVYKVLENIEPEAVKTRKKNIEKRRKNEITRIIDAVEQGIPYEYLNYNKADLFGYSSKFLTMDDGDKIKNRIQNLLRSYDPDSAFTFYKLDYLTKAVRRIKMLQEIEKGKTVFAVAKEFNIHSPTLYRIQKQYVESSKYLPEVTTEQNSIIIKNMKIFEDFKNNYNINKIAKVYKIDRGLVVTIIKVMKDVEIRINNHRDNGGKHNEFK
ncbi:helix-turn-helix domain-containing protein [Macrococcus carouselicus]|uniref:Helix-turn-helix domain-containing protein n=1 Tax=Macrococcus carouselicus TaxID=69969 RepID=A0A9Q8CJK0_9STAP|nr:helix-turn-helix domain-containing protein [Macrococcus carouselicus]TDL95510.1 helix-turn-helix domain-containing protein [Macrococcus carouselicus]